MHHSCCQPIQPIHPSQVKTMLLDLDPLTYIKRRVFHLHLPLPLPLPFTWNAKAQTTINNLSIHFLHS